jgi:peptidoglycan glycosyltransferase
MKQISKRALCALAVAVILALGAVLFSVLYFVQGDDWIVFSGSPHVYTGGNLDAGIVVDMDGTVLLEQTDGVRTYAADPQVRKATMHLLGDRYGYIAGSVLGEYADELVGYNPITGIYSTGDANNTLRLTVNAQVQAAALSALGGRSGTVGVYNYKTGEILCAVTSPTYDPDDVPDVENDTTGAYDGVYLNRFLQSTYVPGSIFKVITTAAALETIDDIEEQTFYCEGTLDIDGDTITCSGVHGTVTLEQALAHSCNCAFAQIALEVGEETLTEYAQRAGVLSSYSFDGLTTATGSFDLTDAVDSEVAWAGIGQYTDLVNPCSYMVWMGAIAGNGQAALPYLVSAVVNANSRTTYQAQTTQTETMLSRDTAERLQELMRNNVVSTYGAAQFGDLTVCAKSGTAEVGEDLSPHATFAGFVLDEDYPLAFIVVVENAGSGSGVCAPIAATVLAACAEAMD